MLFEAMSGLHINMSKSIIYHMNDVSELNMLVEICNGVIQKFEKRLASWQRQYLSLRGRFILINGILNSIPTYFMSLFPIAAKIQNQIDRLGSTFLWEGNSLATNSI